MIISVSGGLKLLHWITIFIYIESMTFLLDIYESSIYTLQKRV